MVPAEAEKVSENDKVKIFWDFNVFTDRCYVRATEQVEYLEEFFLMFILDCKASSCQDCCIKCIVLSEYYPTNNDSQFISKNIHCCVTEFLLSVPKPKNHFSLCVHFKTPAFSTEEPSSP